MSNCFGLWRREKFYGIISAKSKQKFLSLPNAKKSFTQHFKKCAGFTLIELLVVIAVIALLSTLTLTSFSSVRMKGRDIKRITDLQAIRKALEMFYNDNGYYPKANCPPDGWDCNGYRYSKDASWATLASNLAPYLPSLPKDPINNTTCEGPWVDGCHSYTYGNVGRNGGGANPNGRIQYDLWANLEDASNPQRCGLTNAKLYFDDRPCANYSTQMYRASPR